MKLLFVNPDKWIDENVRPSITIVDNIKKFIDSPLAIAITALIPGQWDDTLRTAFSAHLHIVLDLFMKVKGDGVLEAKEPLEKKMKRFTDWLTKQTPAVRAAVYAKLCARLAKENAGNDLVVKNHAVDLLTQAAYSKLKSAVNEDDLMDEAPALDSYFKRTYE